MKWNISGMLYFHSERLENRNTVDGNELVYASVKPVGLN
jgi:hypothetical protein